MEKVPAFLLGKQKVFGERPCGCMLSAGRIANRRSGEDRRTRRDAYQFSLKGINDMFYLAPGACLDAQDIEP